MLDPPESAPRRRVILGLGNPGARYEDTRHNVGFRVVETLARRRGARFEENECNTFLARDGDLMLAAPQTYMNRSGHAARCLAERRTLAPEDFLVVYDEVQLPIGALRLRPRGSPGGHRGMESVLESLGTDRVPRLRLGIAGESGPPGGEEIVGFVLEPFAEDEEDEVEKMIDRAAEACELWAREGAEAAMQRFNRRAESRNQPEVETDGC